MQNQKIVARFDEGSRPLTQVFTTPRPWFQCDPELPLVPVETLRAWETVLASRHPPLDLTPHAGFVSARWLLSLVPHVRQVTVLIGPGHNGTDGLWMARHLATQGVTTWVLPFHDEADRPSHQQAAWREAERAGVRVCTEPPCGSDVVVDASLGTSQTRALTPAWALRLHKAQGDIATRWWLNLDVPTGLCPRSGLLLGPPPSPGQRRATLTLVTLKPGLFMEHGPALCGEIWFSGLNGSNLEPSVPPLPASQSPDWRLNHPAHHRPGATPRSQPRHKGEGGSVWVIGGSSGMEGALRLAALAALSSGPGKTWIVPLGDSTGGWPPECLVSPLASVACVRPWGTQDVIAFGCGAGAAPDETTLLTWLRTAPRMVIDADGLNRLASSPQLQDTLRQRADRGFATILTPHPLEAARLLRRDVQAISQDRMKTVRQLAETFTCVVALKGAGTLISGPSGPVVLNPTGSPALAIGGSGDVLAGWMAGQWAQCPHLADVQARQDQAHAVCAQAVWQHGLAAQLPPRRRRIPGTALVDRLASLDSPHEPQASAAVRGMPSSWPLWP